MKRLLSGCLLIVCLSIPVFGGHTQVGDWCQCGSFAGCICDPGEQPLGSKVSDSKKPSQRNATDLGSEAFLILAALLLVLRYKA